MVVYGVCVLALFTGFAYVAHSFALRRTAIALAAIGILALGAAEAWDALGRGLSQCARSISGISVPEPDLVCGGAFGILAIGVALALAFVVSGFLGPRNVA